MPRSRPPSSLRSVLPALVAVLVVAITATGGTVAYLARVGGSSTTGSSGRSSASQGRPAVSPPPAASSVVLARLGRLYLPDAVVRLSAPPGADAAGRASRAPGLQGAVAVSYGAVQFLGRSAKVMGVDPSTFRGFTPRPTAASDPLWQAVARGEAIASYPFDRAGKVPLGSGVPLGTLGRVRIGALAEFSLPNVDAVVARPVARAAGVQGDALLVSSPMGDARSLTAALGAVLGQRVSVTMLRPAFTPTPTTSTGSAGTSSRAGSGANGSSSSSSSASGGVVAGGVTDLRTLYQRAAATCPGLPWGVLAGIGQVETDHGRAVAVSSAGAQGPMQFLPSTFAVYGVDGNGDGKADINKQADAVYSAARYLCASGGGQSATLRDAIFSYNHSDSYVNTVLALAHQYQ